TQPLGRIAADANTSDYCRPFSTESALCDMLRGRTNLVANRAKADVAFVGFTDGYEYTAW
ncbi:hypothetical protein, partial [Bradyrhizobium sp. UFLA05-112]